MSERMTDDMWHGNQHSMTRAMLHDEGTRARRVETEQAEIIKALADALEAAKVAMRRGEFGDKGRDRDVPAKVDAALRLAGRLP